MAEATRKPRGSKKITPTAAKKTSATAGRKTAAPATTQRVSSTTSAAPKKTAAKKTNGKTAAATVVKTAPGITIKVPTPAMPRKLATKKETNGSSLFTDPKVRQAEIARRAYLLAERRGFATGHEMEDWLAAEASLDR